MDGLLDWYWLGVAAGLGVSAGIAAAKSRGFRFSLPALVALAAGLTVGVIAEYVAPWALLAGFGGLVVGALSLRRLSAQAVPAAVLAAAALAFVPAVGYLEAVAAPLLGERLRRRAGERYAGLRILARD